MTETEKRVLAAELAIIEITAWIDADKVADAVASIRTGLLPSISSAEREARLQAIQLLTDGARRFEPFALGTWMKAGR